MLNSTALADHYRQVRAQTLALAAPLSAEDAGTQSMPDASPAKWHLAHSSWFFETFVLERWEAGFTPFDPAFRVLFNSYYNAVGDKHPRAQRGLLTRPGLEAVKAYRADVDRRVLRVLDRLDAAALALVELGLHHEQQHQELLLTDLLHLFSCNPLLPAYTEGAAPAAAPLDLQWHAVDESLAEIGHAGEAFAFDNEGPRHRVHLPAFEIASRLVSNTEYAGFIDAGGYSDPALWLSEGWDWLKTHGRTHPLYWHRGERGWQAFTLAGLRALDGHAPVRHVSYYEADAYARWAGARLPTEAEWEHAAQHAGGRLQQLDGEAWQWTASAYLPYPGFRVSEGAVGEYNGKFMVNQMVLRGSSCATPLSHRRLSYRNFFPASACWQFSGIRLARSA
jgi:ergothioneine biosynthesis protein EgtB